MKRNGKPIRAVAVLSLCATTLVSCLNDVDLSQVSPEVSLPNSLALPLGNARMALGDLLEKMPLDSGLLSMNSNGSDIDVTISQEMEYSFDAISLSDEIPDFDVVYSFASFPEFDIPGVPDELPIPSGQTISNLRTIDFFDMGLNQNEQEIIKSASIRELVFRADIVQNIEGLRSENIRVKVLFDEDKVQYAGGGTSGAVPGPVGAVLQDGLLRFENIDIYPYSGRKEGLPMTVVFELYTGDTDITLHRTDELKINLSVETLDWKVAYGSFSVIELDRQVERIGDFDLSFLGGLKFYNPQVQLDVRTNVGMPFSLDLEYLKSYYADEAGNPLPGTEEYAQFDGSRSTVLTLGEYAKMPGEWSGWNTFALNRTYGEIHRLFANDSTPNVLEMAYSVHTPATDRDDCFITPEARMELKARAVIPLHFDSPAEDNVITVSDTIRELELDSLLPEAITLQRAYLGLELTNGLPVDVVFSLAEFLDADGQPVDVALPSTSCDLSGVKVDEDGRLAGEPVTQPFDLDISAEAYEQLRRVNRIRYEVTVKQKAGEKIHFEQDNFFGVRLGVFLQGNITAGLFENEEEE